MKITLYSNFMNHHQIELCDHFNNYENIDFRFVATERINEERIKLGYEDLNESRDYIIRVYESNASMNEAKELAKSSDVVIIGSANMEFVKERILNDKLTFRYSERIFKNPGINIISFLTLLVLFKNKFINSKNYYLLAASSYASKDFNIFNQFNEKTLKWGYFPKTVLMTKKEIENKFKDEVIKILWVGRFIKWKHPEKMLYLAENLKNNSVKHKITMIGNGEIYNKIKDEITKRRLENEIELLGAIEQKKVMQIMKKSHVFIFTSNLEEGWGAVLNEAMNCGCACISAHTIGSSNFLIENNDNGIIYNFRNDKDLLGKVENLIKDRKLMKKLAQNAYITINEEWCSKVAVENFIEFINGKTIINGPMSKAEKLGEKDYLKRSET